jgi:hypothetical protein
MEELKDYVITTTMWWPEANTSAVLAEFAGGYYGTDAAVDVLAFIRRMQAAAQASGETLGEHTNLPQTWQTDGPAFLNSSNFGVLLRANADFESAFAAAALGEVPVQAQKL